MSTLKRSIHLATSSGEGKKAVVTGASSGIGAATARALAGEGFHVFCVARRTDRIVALASEIGGTAVTCDVTRSEDAFELAEVVGDSLHVLVNNAGGAVGTDHVAQSDPNDWRWMYETNVIGLLNITKALLPALVSSDDGLILNIGSTAGRGAYEGGGGYTASKHGTKVVTQTLRLELFDQPVRVTEIAPGMVKTEEFSLVRFAGDQDRYDAVYDGMEPLMAEDIADAISWVVTRPSHVNIDEMVIKPRAQASRHKIHRVVAEG